MRSCGRIAHDCSVGRRRGTEPAQNGWARSQPIKANPIYSEDLNVFKVFTLPNGQRIRFETSFGNLFNRTLFGEPAKNWSAANFGQVFSQAKSPRSLQMALRYDF